MNIGNSKIVGIVNVTPDSFTDGGDYFTPEAAYRRVGQLLEEGADLVDIGGESTRPGAQEVSLQEEWLRLQPVLHLVQKAHLGERISVDTSKAEIMRRSLELGVRCINDIKGGADEETLKLLARHGVTYIAMHMHQSPINMQKDPLDSASALRQVALFYEKTHALLTSCGFAPDKIWLDPGIGFGKSDAANMQLMAQAMRLSSHFNIMLGISRKSLLGRLWQIPAPKERDNPSKALELAFMMCGICAIRTHEVAILSRMRGLLNSDPEGRGHG